nr:HlyD family efflux transporter periplasmic adaptor subunit [Parvularcula maris]
MLFGEKESQAALEHYPAVAVVFIDGDSEGRALPLEGLVSAERVANLRATSDGVVDSVAAVPGAKVAAGDTLCTLRRGDGKRVLLRTTLAGEVSAVSAKPGSALAKGEPCASVTDTSSMIVTAELSAPAAEVVQPGDTAELIVAERKMRGKVRVVYPPMRGRPDAGRIAEIEMPEGHGGQAGMKAEVRIRTQQISAVHVPFDTLTLHPAKGMSVRIVQGDGPLGVIETLPVLLVAATDKGFYVDGLPESGRLVVNDVDFPPPVDGEKVRIGKVI